MKTIFQILFLSIGLLLTGCVKNNPNPSWLEIKAFTVEKNPLLDNNEGDLSLNAFTNGWVYINDEFIGVFELPCKIPVMKYGAVNIRVYPTVLNNGLAATKKIYPFVDAYEEQINMEGGQTTTVTPKTRYTTGTHFWTEGFEGSVIKIHDGTDTKTSLLVSSSGGKSIGKVTLTPEANLWSCYISAEASDQSPFMFPIGTQVYLEFECKNTVPIKTKLIYAKADGSTSTQVHYGASTHTEGWKKMYIDYSELVATSGGIQFWFAFTSTLPEDAASGEVLIDNIKLVYR